LSNFRCGYLQNRNSMNAINENKMRVERQTKMFVLLAAGNDLIKALKEFNQQVLTIEKDQPENQSQLSKLKFDQNFTLSIHYKAATDHPNIRHIAGQNFNVSEKDVLFVMETLLKRKQHEVKQLEKQLYGKPNQQPG